MCVLELRGESAGEREGEGVVCVEYVCHLTVVLCQEVSMLSLKALFHLMHNFNLEYQHFYHKLYSLLEPQVEILCLCVIVCVFWV